MQNTIQTTGSLWKDVLMQWPLWLLSLFFLALGTALLDDLIFSTLSSTYRNHIVVVSLIIGLASFSLAGFLVCEQRHRCRLGQR